MTNISIVCAAAALAISVFAFAHGAAKLLKKGKPLYCQIIMWAVACYCLQCIETCVVYLCGDFSDNGVIGRIAMCGFAFALLSANFGAMDGLVDDRNEANGKFRKYALLAPLVLLAADAAAVANILSIDRFAGVMYGISLLPALPASYYSLKHLLLPKDSLGLLPCTRKCNIISLVIFALGSALLIIYGRVSLIVSDVINLALAVLVLGLVLAAEKGEKSWPI